MKMVKEKIKLIFVIVFLFTTILSVNTFAFENEFELKTTNEYDEWNNLPDKEKEEKLMPSASSPDIPESVVNKYRKKNSSIMLNYIENTVKGIKPKFYPVGASVDDSRFNLAEKLQMRVENQGSTTECWAFSTLKSLETNYAINHDETGLRNFSERHMDYATSQSFTNNAVNEYGLNRKVTDGGLPISGLAYLTNGQGAVLEEKMPFEDNKNLIDISSIKGIPVDTIVTDYRVLPAIKKQYVKNSNGNTTSVKYYNAKGKEYSAEELEAARNIIKEHLLYYGAITTMTGGSYAKFYSNPSNPFKSVSYNCNDSTKVRDHAITIVGWDDNYSKDNFVEGAKPSSNGAYIVLNSYGESSFNKGYLYVSYEDAFIEDESYGIINSTSYDYDYIYQYDTFGGIFEIGTSTTNKGYIGTTFKRKTTSDEVLTSVGFTIPEYSTANIYINPNGTSMAENDLIKVATVTDLLAPGYHRIDIEPTRIKGSEFAIVIEQFGENGTFYFSVEAPQKNTGYSNVTSENKSFISTDFKEWINLSDVKVTIDTKNADVCIKGFSEIDPYVEEPTEPEVPTDNPTEPEIPTDNQYIDEPVNPETPDNPTEDVSIESNVYKIDKEFIMNVRYETTLKDFMSNIESNANNIIIKENGNTITDENQIIKTGMILDLSNGEKYSIIVRGDIKEDGKITLTDLSKLILHYNEMKGFELTGNSLKAADMNLDGRVSLVDVSQMIVLYNEI